MTQIIQFYDISHLLRELPVYWKWVLDLSEMPDIQLKLIKMEVDRIGDYNSSDQLFNVRLTERDYKKVITP